MDKNKKTLNRILELCLYSSICILMICVFQKGIRAEQNEQIPLEGIPLEYVKESYLIRKSIDQIADDGNRVYVLFDKYEGILQIYSTEGIYEKTVTFYGGTNGAFKIAVKDSVLYVCDKTGNLYLFADGNLVEFIKRSDGEVLRRSIDFETNSTRYVLRWGSVWDVSRTEEKCIIQRPVSAVLAQGNLVTVVGISALLIIGFMRRKVIKP